MTVAGEEMTVLGEEAVLGSASTALSDAPDAPGDILIIPDIHQKWWAAERLLREVPHGRAVILGDYFDDFDDNLPPRRNDTEQTARWLVNLIETEPEERLTLLMGNHDLWYRWDGIPTCSGNDRRKKGIIQGIMSAEHWQRFRAFTGVQPGDWLVSHAGFHPRLLATGYGPDRQQEKSFIADAAVDASAGRWHPWIFVGQTHGGCNPFGGIFWMDWREFPATPGVKQIVGHTAGSRVRSADVGTKQERHCLDTNLRNYGVIDGGTGNLWVRKTPPEWLRRPAL